MNLTGVLVPLITPFGTDGEVAADALEGLADRLLAAGASGLVALGTTGEPSSLSAAEQRVVVEAAARACRAHDAILIVGGKDPELLARGDAALSVVPPFVRPGEAGVLEYFRRLKCPVPLVIYHVPYRTGQQLGAETLRRIAELPGVAGIKYAAGGIDDETMLFLTELPKDFAVLAGDDPFVSPMLALGAHGGILASAHLATGSFVAMVAAWRAGDVATGRRLGHQLVPLSKALFAEPNPTVIKAVLHANGEIPTPDVRLPLLPAGPRTTEVARSLAETKLREPKTALSRIPEVVEDGAHTSVS
ncbi:4-hydroxy-tetrahydrodipicolinate synthase [Kribbella sp. ALI-6-A]|uniref:dihydrodipicolinate synthase family protein n=1 Tax=Kribbella sp. ALI-6-A TaxID=1933817 RepID=UPI00097BFA17|nr:dihydrodipicolinate synthase family protein [Kribbella sp. ALI-6-A]ONI69125.1 4-hydroxy-tetrahydrodipicolinate synthase [Kribbella sp. ALI-6-A]